jgi:hypothetical protein
MADARALKMIGVFLAMVTFAVTSTAGMVVSAHVDHAQVDPYGSR